MPELGAGDTIIRCEFRHVLHGNAIWSVLHYLPETALLSADLMGFADLLGDAWSDAGGPLPFMYTGCVLTEVAVQQIAPQRGPLIVSPRDDAGTAADEPLPNQTALVVSSVTESPGRRARGRTYIGGLTVGSFDGSTGLFTIAAAENIATAVEDLDQFAALQAAHPGDFVVWSDGAKVLGELLPPEFFHTVMYVGRRIPAVIRRRRLGQGI